MASNAIEIRLEGLNEAIESLDKLQKLLEERTDEFVNRLGKLGVRYAEMYYSMAPNAGPDDVSVTLEETGNRGEVRISAGGTQVWFIEFGTGVGNPDSEEARAVIEQGNVLRHGQFGEGHAEYPPWYFDGRVDIPNPPMDTKLVGHYDRKAKRVKYAWKTYGQPAWPVMYMTRKDLIDNIESIAREVFFG